LEPKDESLDHFAIACTEIRALISTASGTDQCAYFSTPITDLQSYLNFKIRPISFAPRECGLTGI
jgi:hypothetical protein